jgi:carboxylate-amine ligase
MKHNYHSNLQIGLELELQLINTHNQDLSASSKKIIRHIQNDSYSEHIKPEITQSMIEINSSPHYKPATMHKELQTLCYYLKHIADKEKVSLCGGGTHPFQDWKKRKIFPSERFRNLAKQYGYLAKRYTVFSMHVHVSCSTPEKAIYLTHMLSRYVPHFIALSASSPFYHGINTGFNSSRSNIAAAFPLSGHMPMLKNWSDFCRYFYKMQNFEIINSMKDFYWDIRPKPEYGTVEIRVCDMPLTLNKTIALVAYIQCLAAYLDNQPFELKDNLYDTYHYNRFQSSKFGFEGLFINPFTNEKMSLQKDILATIRMLRPNAKLLGTSPYLYSLKQLTKNKYNDANFLKEKFTKESSLLSVVKENCRAWKSSLLF